MARRDARAARAALAQLLQRHPEYAPGWLTASLLELDLQRPAHALIAAERALALGLADPALRVQHIRCLHAAGHVARALAALPEAERLLDDHPHLQHELGNAATALDAQTEALRLLQRARAKLPAHAPLAYNIAAVLRTIGRFAEAESELNRAIRDAPQDYEAYLARSHLRTQTESDNHVAQLRQLLDAGIEGWFGQVQIHYALAKENEDLGRFEDSFAHLREGADLRRRHLRYDIGSDIAAMASIQACFDANYLAAAPRGDAGEAAIFVFGLPRSGTTLVDRILSSHPDVDSLGELNDFPASVITCATTTSAAKEELIARAARVPPHELGSAYLTRVHGLKREKSHFIDKLPMNYLYAGLIAASLPKARLIHVKRHPMANAYGMYKVLFHQGYPFSYDLDELGRYIAAYRRLMAHWRSLLGDRLVTVTYEHLVTHQESETRRLVAACGLPWHEACLSPHKNAAPSATQSAVQVRRPVHGEAIDHWRHFAAQLAPLKARLLAEGVPAHEMT
jgi:tetratricopeptide (TPR) repeat protein